MVVNLWGGQYTAEADTPWERGAIVNTWSRTKTIAGKRFLLLADQGEIDLGRKAARYWPEFSIEDKEDVTIAYHPPP